MRTFACFALALATVAVGCATGPSTESADTTESALRPLTADELLGTITYGETKEVDFKPSPKYRAFSFRGEKGDIIEAKVASLDATDPVLWLTDEHFNTLSVNNDTSVGDVSATIRNRLLPKTGTFYLVFREMNFAPRAQFAVSLRKTAAQAPECDPDGEGIADPECVNPTGIDPFDPASCAGPALTADEATAKFSVAGGLALTGSKIYYRTRQCNVGADGATSDCSPWVRSFLMDIPILKAQVPAGAPANTFQLVAATNRTKVKIDFGADPAALKQFCVDGPFRNVQNDAWFAFEDGTGVCGTTNATEPTVTATCARFEPATIQVGSQETTRYTEYSAVLLARY